MSESSTIDPYKTLGITKNATIAEVKSAYRKLVLQCHPDKIKDEEQRKDSLPRFQKVQSSYELLMNEKKRAEYDNKARHTDQGKKFQTKTRKDDAGTTTYQPSAFAKSYEYRDGALYEERAPKSSSRFFESDVPFFEEPRPSSRKYDGYRKKQSTEEKEKKKSRQSNPPVPSRSSKDHIRDARESVKSSRSDRAKNRDKERKRDRVHSEKHPKAFVVSEPETDTDSDIPYYTNETADTQHYTATTSDRQQYTATTPDRQQYTATTSDRQQYTASTPDRQQYTASTPDRQQYTATTPDTQQYSATNPEYQHYTTMPQPQPQQYEEHRRRSKPDSKESSSRHSKDDEEDYTEEWSSSKLDDAKKYIQRSKSGGYSYDTDRHPSSSWSSPSAHRAVHVDTPHRSSATPRTRDSPRPSLSGRDRMGSADVLDSSLKPHMSPRIPTLQSTTSAPSGFKLPFSFSSHRSTSKSHPPLPRRSETLPYSVLSRHHTEIPSFLSSKVREPVDSGYSSPGTPEMRTGTSPPVSGRYTVVEDSENYMSHRSVRDPTTGLYSNVRRNQSISPTRRPSLSNPPPPSPLSRSRTYNNYPLDHNNMPTYYESSTIPSLRTTAPAPSGAGLFGEVPPNQYETPKIIIPDSDIRYSPHISEENIRYSYVPSSRKGSLDPNGYR
ncbi:DnaJ domain-containing protein [Paracoccidioides lutzii Pb01]|uniref:DnaJ domain-containing protein n=1 Tax=Paracoccidioides lutzii (strain ATCC MYA-826 / Pb01) TaxID=502779 RepID=C1GTJ3_PARBA|nr:DnaJ domain-containing protein [Paracoccidioides lutzii Pb01]EEH39649.2 DnaJ domain-containing protein [Paracoccidioides lutzii Pb01]